MANATAIINKINNALLKVGPLNKVLYTRVVTTTGDVLIGRTTSSFVDTIMSPPPIAIQAGREHLSGQRDQVTTVNTPSGIRLSADDYVITASDSSISQAQLQDENLYFVLKNQDGSQEEVLFIMDSSNVQYQGTNLIYQIYARSVKTP